MTDGQSDLFGMPNDEEPAAPFSEPTSSRDAAEAIESERENLREIIYRDIKAREEGLTCEEVCEITGLDGNTVRPRIWELTGQARGFEPRIIKTEKRRRNVSGRTARVYVAL